MNPIYLLVIGWIIFIISSIVLGILLRKMNSKKAAENIIRIMHTILIISIILPLFYAIGNQFITIDSYDKLLNIPSLPFTAIFRIAGVVMMLIGISLTILAKLSLLVSAEGLPLLTLTKKLDNDFLYKHVRNPMMLGFYLAIAGIGFLAGSTFFTFWPLIIFIPSHIFWLKFFEEHELEMRFGQSYREYKQRVPFLIPSFRKK